MRIITTKTEAYQFNELSEEVQTKVLESNHDINIDHSDWFDSELDLFKEIGKALGIEIRNIYFSGFSSQGDGACFTGRYHYGKQALKNLSNIVKCDEINRIASELQSIQKDNFYGIYASIKHYGHYNNENCTRIEVFSRHNNDSDYQPDIIIELLRDYMRWIYKQLEKQHDYLISEEAIKETLIANECEFTKEGKMILAEESRS